MTVVMMHGQCYATAMKIVIVYGTNSSGTQAVSAMVGDVLEKAGHTVTIKRANEPKADHLNGYDLVILGSCTWERFEGEKHLDGQLQQHMYDLVQKLQDKPMPGQKFAVFGLGDSSYMKFCEAANHLERFVEAVQGKLVIPSLRFDGFFFDLDKNRERAEEWAEGIAQKVKE